MKITHVLWSLKYGGAETMLVDIVNGQCRQHDVEILLINDNIDNSLLEQIDPTIQISRINRPLKSRNVFYLIKLNLLILFSHSDIIHFHQDDIIRYIPVYFLKRNLCLTVHSVELGTKQDLNRYNFVFAVSEDVRQRVLQEAQRDSIVILNGINIQKFNTKKRVEETEIFKIAQIGRLNHLHKGQHIALMAIHQLVTKYNYTKIHLDIIGEGDSYEYLKNLAMDLSIQPYVTFCGNKTKDYIRENLSHYDLLIQPSFWEGFGLVIIEAMSAMTPTLISNVDGMKTISQEGRLSYTFQPGDVDDFAEKLYQIIHTSISAREKLAEEAYNFVLDNFDISATINNYLASYADILTRIKR
jgi:glycosyltransferase involved in cell wall biosynthesis